MKKKGGHTDLFGSSCRQRKRLIPTRKDDVVIGYHHWRMRDMLGVVVRCQELEYLILVKEHSVAEDN